MDRPLPPAECTPGLLAEWEAYFDSDLARATYAETDYPALSRLWSLKQMILDLTSDIRRDGPFVTGSRGQSVPHPATRVRNALLQEVRLLENRFGLNPHSRMSLGVDLGRAYKTLADVAAEVDTSGQVDRRQRGAQ